MKKVMRDMLSLSFVQNEEANANDNDFRCIVTRKVLELTVKTR